MQLFSIENETCIRSEIAILYYLGTWYCSGLIKWTGRGRQLPNYPWTYLHIRMNLALPEGKRDYLSSGKRCNQSIIVFSPYSQIAFCIHFHQMAVGKGISRCRSTGLSAPHHPSLFVEKIPSLRGHPPVHRYMLKWVMFAQFRVVVDN